MLRNVFNPEIILHGIWQSGPNEITSRFAVRRRIRWIIYHAMFPSSFGIVYITIVIIFMIIKIVNVINLAIIIDIINIIVVTIAKNDNDHRYHRSRHCQYDVH